MVGALNEINDGLPAGGIYDLDNPPKKMIFLARAGSTNLPNGFIGANAVAVIQMNLDNSDYGSMIAFTFAVDKIAIRRKSGTKNWSEWKYFNTAEILSNLTTTNKSSLVGAINELNSNGFFIKHVNESDADNITKPGLYRCSNLIGVAGINFGYMFVFSLYNDERYVLQVLHDANSSDLRRRICISSKWTDWIKM